MRPAKDLSKLNETAYRSHQGVCWHQHCWCSEGPFRSASAGCCTSRPLPYLQESGAPGFAVRLVVGDTQSDSIQFLNFAKKWFIQYSIQYCFAQDSIQNIIQFKKNSADSIQKIIQFISQGIIDTGRMGKVPKNYLKNVQNRLKKGLFIKNGKYRFKIWFIHSFHDKIQFKGLFNIIFFRNIQFEKLFNNLFSRKTQLKNWFKNLNLALFNSTKYSFN